MKADAEAALHALAATPARLMELSRGVDEKALAARPDPNEWSATEIVSHLRANADVWGATIQRMIDQDNPTIRYVSPRGVMKKPDYAERPFKEGLELFVNERKKLVTTLRALPLAGWSRGATFTATTRRHGTVLSYAQQMAAHEAAHLVQFEALFD